MRRYQLQFVSYCRVIQWYGKYRARVLDVCRSVIGIMQRVLYNKDL